MKQSEFNSLSKEKLIEGLISSYENSRNLFKAAEELSTKENMVSFAISLMILSAEEALKSIIFLLKINKEDIDEIIEAEYLFSNHPYKHNLLESVFEDFIKTHYKYHKLLLENFTKYSNKEDNTYDLLEKQIQKSEKIRKKLLNSKKEILEWWKNANTQKMKGFYLDYKNKKWVKPIFLTKEDYLKCFYIVGTILLPLTIIIEFQVYVE